MPLSPGTRLGAYEVLSLLGAGGMGEVYRARDTRLRRSVAVKVLPEAVASDTDRIARFEREAKSLAALNHPHIAQLYGLEEAPDPPITFLVMELVEGQTLEQRIARGRLALDETLAFARQIAEALEAAHEKGIIHRDLKPANVKLTLDDRVKVLDFGLAKAMEGSASLSGEPPGPTHSPTLSLMATQAGVILGTAAYMSPEQAKGFPADQRSDVFSFGVVLYEMLTGRQPFHGETAPEILASVLIRDADLHTLPPDINPRLVDLLKRCLQKNPKQRWQHVGDVRAELETIAADPRGATSGARTIAPPRSWPLRILPALAAAIICGALAAAAAWMLKPERPQAITRFVVPLGEGQQFTNAGRQVVAISHDGTKIVYVANQRLFLRAMHDKAARPIAGSETTGAVVHPVFSPDDELIAYWASIDQTVRRIAVSGGVPVTVTAAPSPLGMSWTGDSILVGLGAAGIGRVPVSGGTLDTIAEVAAGELAHGPQLLADGDSVLFTIAKGVAVDRWDKARVVIQSLKRGTRTTIVDGGSDARYLPTGHLVYGVGGVLFAAPVDIRRPSSILGATPIVEGVRRVGGSGTGTAQFSVSDTGTLAYVAGPVSSAGRLDLILVDAKGVPRPFGLRSATYQTPRVSPDGRQVAIVTDEDKDATIWIYDLSGTSAMRKLTIGGRNLSPNWSPDGQRIIFQSDREGGAGIFWIRADGTGVAERLTKADEGTTHVPESVSPDGRYLLFGTAERATNTLHQYSFADKKIVPFASVASSQPTCATFSPDGRWVAYTAGSRSGLRLYAQPFPPNGTTYEIGVGIHPMWSRDGKQLFFGPAPSRLASVAVSTSPAFTFGKPVESNRVVSDSGPASQRSYDLTPDGSLVGIAPVGSTEVAQPAVEVVLNWFEELKARVPTK